MKAAFFPGCLIPARYPQMEKAIRLVAPKLGLEIIDPDGFTCCPDPLHVKPYDRVAAMAISARNLCIAEEQGIEDIFTICSGCTASLREAVYELDHDPRLRDEVNQRLRRIGKQYQGTVRVRHLVTLLRDEIGLDAVKSSVVQPLEGIRVAVHYGCHLLKPREIMGVDDPDDPRTMIELLQAIGAEPIKHDEWFLCCGKGCFDDELKGEMTHTVLSSIRDSQAQLMGVICPACFSSFDIGQIVLARKRNEQYNVPPVYYFQLLALAQGFSADDVGLDMHRMKPEALLQWAPLP
jgi:heterodisulfide reductase subunit B2